MKPTHRISLAGNLLMWFDLTFGPSFKVKRWFTGFDELSFRWIQICIGSPIRRPSLYMSAKYKWKLSKVSIVNAMYIYIPSESQDILDSSVVVECKF